MSKNHRTKRGYITVAVCVVAALLCVTLSGCKKDVSDDTATFPFTKSEAVCNLDNLGGGNGYEIVFTMSADSADYKTYYGCTADCRWVKAFKGNEGVSGAAVAPEGDKYRAYSFRTERSLEDGAMVYTEVWTVADGYDDKASAFAAFSDTAAALAAEKFIYAVYDGAYAALAVETPVSAYVAGRKCNEYKAAYSDGTNYSSLDFFVDDALGICLKYDVSLLADGITSGTSYEVITFSTSPTAPDFSNE